MHVDEENKALATELYETGEWTLQALADMFGVTKAAVHQWIRARTDYRRPASAADRGEKCSVTGCDEPVKELGRCRIHAQRHRRGHRVYPRPRLTEEKRREVADAYEPGVTTQAEVAEFYGLSQTYVSHLVRTYRSDVGSPFHENKGQLCSCGCGRPAYCRGMSNVCYQRWLYETNPEVRERRRTRMREYMARKRAEKRDD